MKKEEADKTLKRIESLYMWTPFKNNQSKLEYAKYFMRCDYELMEETIQKIMIEGTERYKDRCPTIAEINTEYKKLENIDKINNWNKTDCKVCMGRGFETVRRKIHDIEYEFVLHCDCPAGEQWAYDGQNNKGVKTNYFAEPISKYYDLDILAAENVDKDHTVKPMPDYVKKALAKALDKMGARM